MYQRFFLENLKLPRWFAVNLEIINDCNLRWNSSIVPTTTFNKSIAICCLRLINLTCVWKLRVEDVGRMLVTMRQRLYMLLYIRIRHTISSNFIWQVPDHWFINSHNVSILIAHISCIIIPSSHSLLNVFWFWSISSLVLLLYLSKLTL